MPNKVCRANASELAGNRVAGLEAASDRLFYSSGAAQVDEPLARMRSELARRLSAQGKTSLYSTLGLLPDASDAAIAAAIADLAAGSAQGRSVSPAEFKYAKETLGDPKLRDQYDRRLLDSFLNDGGEHMRMNAYEAVGRDVSSRQSEILAALVAVLSLSLSGYLAVGFFQMHGGHEIRSTAADTPHGPEPHAGLTKQARDQKN